MGITNALNNRPVRVLGFVTALHSLVYGIGYLTSAGGFGGALVGLDVRSLAITNSLGIVLTISGAVLMWAYARLNPKTIRTLSRIQSLIWLFITMLYLVNGAYLLALGVGFTWAIVSGYLAYATRNRVSILAYDRTDRAMQDTEDEDQL